MNYEIAFAPLLPNWLLVVTCLALSVPVFLGLARKVRGAVVRTVALLILCLALFNPSILVEEREALKSVVAVVVDESASQKMANRMEQTDAIRQSLLSRLEQLDAFEVREIVAGDQISPSTDVSTALFTALESGIKDIPPDRLAGAVFITDGQVHDIPEEMETSAFKAPIHALITGEETESDRRMVIVESPRYGVVGESFELRYRVDQSGFPTTDPVAVSIYVDGELITVEEVNPGETYVYVDEIRHGGRNIIELHAEVHPDELSETNNRAVSILNGIRENLRVLLVSGEPHAGERTWRNLLKSDASVDLVHFTILRPPEKQDGTPISQLSLIAFPTRELFVEKIDEFDLIIFDRYSRRGVLPVLYFDNIARYVRDGGAVLVAAGPEYGQDGSIAATPLSDVLPAMPNGQIREEPFLPAISEIGGMHPVTRNLDSGSSAEVPWSRWFRSIGVEDTDGEVVMHAANQEPLLVLQRYDEGRVALLLSDHAWLWARGFEGGGPHVQMLRRMAHWLMKEPELDEERLTAESDGNELLISRQTLDGDPGTATLQSPTGEELSVELMETTPGVFTGILENPEIGLYRVANGELAALVNVGPPNPREFDAVMSTTELLKPALTAIGGDVRRVAGEAPTAPRILPVRPGAQAHGNGWIGFNDMQASVLKGINRISLFAGLLGLAILLFAFAAMWTREGR